LAKNIFTKLGLCQPLAMLLQTLPFTLNSHLGCPSSAWCKQDWTASHLLLLKHNKLTVTLAQ